MNIIEANGIEVRLKLDYRISKKSSKFDSDNPTYPVKIGIKWMGETAERVVGERLPMDYRISPREFKMEYQNLVKGVLRPFLNTVIEYKDVMETMKTWDFDDFKQRLKDFDKVEDNETTLLSKCFDDKIRVLDQEGLKSSKYVTVRNSLIKFNKTLPQFEEINAAFLERWADWMREDKNKNGRSTSEASIADYASKLKAVWKLAIDNERIGHSLLPFGKPNGSRKKTFQITTKHKRKASMPMEAVVSVMNAVVDDPIEEFHRDIFSLSFHLAGINMIDLLQMKWSQYDQDTNKISWKRNKTKTKMGHDRKTINMMVSPTAQAIIEKHGVTGHSDDFIFNVLTDDMSYITRRDKSDLLADKVTSMIKRVCKIEGYVKYQSYSFYLARHAWATKAVDMDFTTDKISQFLGHESVATTELYVGGLTDKSLSEMENTMSNMLNELSA